MSIPLPPAPPLPGAKLVPGQLDADAIFGAFVARFPGKIATCLTAVAWRESRWIPTVHNANPKTGDDSYGLVQVNLAVKGIAALMAARQITAADLQTPDGNAHAAFLLWGGLNKNLDEAWYILRDGYRQAYEVGLPAAMAAALRSGLGQ